MGNPSTLIVCLLLISGAATAQKAPTRGNDRPLPQWLTGIIAVSCFLLLTFIGLLVKKMWCNTSGRRRNSMEPRKEDEFETGNTYDTNVDVLRGRNSVKGDAVIMENMYDTKLDILRGRNSVESKEHDMDKTYETSLDFLRSSDNKNAYNNLGTDSSEGRATPM